MSESVLDTIVAARKKSIARDKTKFEGSISDKALNEYITGLMGPELKEPGVSIIAEIKKARPKIGVIRDDFSVPDLAMSYLDGGATGVSVLTEPDYFQGAWMNLRAAREFSGLPVLCKDFIIDEFQLKMARMYGADAVLLIAAVLDDARLKSLIKAAHELNLEVLTEATNKAELHRVLASASDLIGINNRNLTNLDVDLNVGLDLLKEFKIDRPVVIESGIETRDDVLRVEEAGANAVLVGTALMKSPDPAAKIRELCGT